MKVNKLWNNWYEEKNNYQLHDEIRQMKEHYNTVNFFQ